MEESYWQERHGSEMHFALDPQPPASPKVWKLLHDLSRSASYERNVDAQGQVTVRDDSTLESEYQYDWWGPPLSYPFNYTIDPTGTVTIDEGQLGSRSGRATKGTIQAGEVSEVGAAFDGLYAGWLNLADTFTVGYGVDDAAKQEAWREAGLEGTWAQSISEGAAKVSFTATLGLVSAGLGTAAQTSVVAARANLALGTYFVGTGYYSAIENAHAAGQNLVDGNYGQAAANLAFAGLNTAFSVLGASRLPAQWSKAFPASRVPQVTLNRSGHEAAVDDFIAKAEQVGFRRLGQGEVTVRTPFGNRKFDLVLENATTGARTGVEIKSTLNAFNRWDKAARQQLAADRWVNQFGADAIGINKRIGTITNTIKLFWPVP